MQDPFMRLTKMGDFKIESTNACTSCVLTGGSPVLLFVHLNIVKTVGVLPLPSLNTGSTLDLALK